MSDRIDEILDVIRETLRIVDPHPSAQQVRSARILATTHVAERRHIRFKTVQDKYGRQLQPDISIVAEFDRLLHSWLTRDSAHLKTVLARHAVDPLDELALARFFAFSASRARGRTMPSVNAEE
jgi:hypothetical protein